MAAAQVRLERKRKEKKRCWSLLKMKPKELRKDDDDEVAVKDA